MSGYENERKAYSKSPLDEISREARLVSYARPLTAKKLDFENHRTQKRCFSRMNSGGKTKKSNSKEKNTQLLEKLRPNRIFIDKERLYIENMQLKVKNNELTEILIKYKAKNLQLEKEKHKKEDSPTPTSSHSSYFVKILKQNIKELKNELQNKENELNKQKKSMKLTKAIEMELEIKAYIDECTRLKHYLEEIIKEKQETFDSTTNQEQNSDTKTSNLLKIIEDNQKEIQKLREKLKTDNTIKTEKIPKIKEEMSKFSKEIETIKIEYEIKEKKYLKDIEKLKKSLQEEQNRSATSNFKLQEMNTLIESLYEELKNIRKRVSSKCLPPIILQTLHNLILLQNKTISEYLKSLAPDNSKYISSSHFIQVLKQNNHAITNQDLDSVISYIKGQNSSEISIQNLINYYNTFDFIEKKNDLHIKSISELFQHLALRMQLHRVPKENLIETLLGLSPSKLEVIHSQEIILLFNNSPFNFSRKEASTIADYLFNSEKSMNYSDFIQIFNNSTDN